MFSSALVMQNSSIACFSYSNSDDIYKIVDVNLGLLVYDHLNPSDYETNYFHLIYSLGISRVHESVVKFSFFIWKNKSSTMLMDLWL